MWYMHKDFVSARGHSVASSGMGSAVGASEVTVCFLFLPLWVSLRTCSFHNVQIAVLNVQINTMFGGKEKVVSGYNFRLILFFDL